jgi:hypothetical protein
MTEIKTELQPLEDRLMEELGKCIKEDMTESDMIRALEIVKQLKEII